MFHRIYKILISLETEQITFYNDLFCEIFLNKYRTQVKKNVNFITNVTKVKNFKRGINFSKSINLFLDFGLTNSNRQLKEQRMVNSYDKKVQYLNMFFIFTLATMTLTVIVSIES